MRVFPKDAMIPDLQIKPGHPTDHLYWLGKYVGKGEPDTIIQIGDLWDMPSLSFYDRGKLSFEGRRYNLDCEAGNLGLAEFDRGLQDGSDEFGGNLTRRRNKKKLWTPRKILLRGNHEERILRAIQDDAKLEGTIGYHDLKSPGWEVHDFLDIVWVHGVAYSHYFVRPLSGRPYSGENIDTRLKNIGHSFTMGHQQVMMFGRRESAVGAMYGLVCGNCYAHDEEYRGPQANDEWRGIVIKHEVRDGRYDPMFVSLDYVCRSVGGLKGGLKEYRLMHGLEGAKGMGS